MKYAMIEAARAECEKHNVDFDWERRSRHLVGLLTFNGQTRKVFFSITPSDYFATRNALSDVRRVIRQLKGIS